MAGCASDGVGIVGAVHADPRFAEADPNHTHRISRARGEHEEFVGPFSMVQDAFIPTESWH